VNADIRFLLEGRPNRKCDTRDVSEPAAPTTRSVVRAPFDRNSAICDQLIEMLHKAAVVCCTPQTLYCEYRQMTLAGQDHFKESFLWPPGSSGENKIDTAMEGTKRS
jgi:hypothetical protein